MDFTGEVAALGDEVAGGLLRLPLLRAMFCELIGKRIRMFREANELFLLGLLSVMDALLNVPMFDALAQIPVGHAIKMALLAAPAGTARFSKLSLTVNPEPGNNWLNPLAASGCTRTFCRICTFSSFGGLGKSFAESPALV
jgi:hypothetical protein